MTTAALDIGSSASSFQILAKIAKGGMAEIFLARAATAAGVERFVVLKRVLRERASDLQFLRMFLDEARLAAQLLHPNIAQVYDVGKLGDSYFFTMEYVHGPTVRALLQRLGRRRELPIPCALAIAAGAAAGLHHAHERIGLDGRPLGIVHRDVSPSNLMVTFEGHVKVVDFGVAKASSRIEETHSGTIKGKISYLSPEQATAIEVDRRSDLFSLGIVLWEMLTGRRLFKRDSDFATMTAIVGERVPPPSSYRSDVSPALDAVVARALAKEPQDRFQTAHEMVDALEAIAVSSGHMFSAATLSRFVRDIFGATPEPWIALQQRDSGYGAVTVTAEPIAKVLAPLPTSEVDQQLASVIDVSASFGDALDVRTTGRFARLPTESEVSASNREPEPAPRRMGLVIVASAVGIAIALAVLISMTSSTPKPRQTASPAAVVAQAPAPADAAAPPSIARAAPADVVEAPKVEPERARPRPAAEDRSSLKACVAGAATSHPTNCTISACRGRDDANAKKWFARVPASKRAAVTSRCKAFGVTLGSPDCDADPARCQF